MLIVFNLMAIDIDMVFCYYLLEDGFLVAGHLGWVIIMRGPFFLRGFALLRS